MPTVRGLIQDIQHNGLLHKGKLTLLNGASIGIDAIHYFEPLYTPPASYDLLGVVDYDGLNAVVVEQLKKFQKHNISPIFVFPGVSPSDRVHTIQQQYDIQLKQQAEYNAQVAAAAEKLKAQQPQQPVDDIMGGFSLYRPTNNKKAKKQKLSLYSQDDVKPVSFPAQSVATSSTTTVEEIQWRFDDEALANRQHGWESIQSKHYDIAQNYFNTMSATFSTSYRKALVHILQQYQISAEYGKFNMIHAPYTVSAQLAWLQRQPHRFVHAVLGQSDVLLFGVEKFLQTIHFDSETFNFISFDEVLAKYNITLTQLISASLLSGYSFALTHPLSLNDLKSSNQFHFSTALRNLVTHGQGSLQKTLEWYIQQPQCFNYIPQASTTHSVSSTNSNTSTIDDKKKGKKDEIDIIDEHARMIENINKVMIQFQGSAVLGPQGKIALLRTTVVDVIDVANIKSIGKSALKVYKLQQQQQLQLQQKLAIAGKKGVAQVATTVEQPAVPEQLPQLSTAVGPENFPTVMVRPQVPLPTSFISLLTTSTIQPSSISSLFTGHILDVTSNNPSLELDQALDYSNLTIRGPAVWSILYSFHINSQAGIIDKAYGSLYQQIKLEYPFYSPFILNSRFNDKRRGVWPRDLIQYMKSGGSESSSTYGVNTIQHFEEKDKLFTLPQFQAFYNIVEQISYDKSTQVLPITHYLTMLPEINRIAPPIVIQTVKKKIKKASSEIETPQTPASADKLDQTEQVVAITMMYMLYFMNLITANGNITQFGAALLPIITQYTNSTTTTVNASILDTLLILFILLKAEILNTKLLTIQSSEVASNSCFYAGKGETSYKQQLQRLLLRILSLININLQVECIGEQTYEQLLSLESRPTNPKATLLNHTFLSILSREFACYSTIANALVQTFQYAYDLILATNVLFFQNKAYFPATTPTICYSALHQYTPLQTFQASPLLSFIVRSNINEKMSPVSNEVDISQIRTVPQHIIDTIAKFWVAVEKNVGSSVSSADVQNALALVQQ